MSDATDEQRRLDERLSERHGAYLGYASEAGQEWLLDLFLPHDRAQFVAAVVYVHSGGGGTGNRQQFWHHAAHLD